MDQSSVAGMKTCLGIFERHFSIAVLAFKKNDNLVLKGWMEFLDGFCK